MPPLPAIGPLASALGVGVACSPGLNSRAIGVTTKTPLNQPWASVVSGQRTTVSVPAPPTTSSASSQLQQQSVFCLNNDDALKPPHAPLVNEKQPSLSSSSAHQNYTSYSTFNDMNPLKRNVVETSSCIVPSSLAKSEAVSSLLSTSKDTPSSAVKNFFPDKNVSNKLWNKQTSQLPSLARVQSRENDCTSVKPKNEQRFQLNDSNAGHTLNVNNSSESKYVPQGGPVLSTNVDLTPSLPASNAPFNIKSEFRNSFAASEDELTTQFQRRWADEMSDKEEEDEKEEKNVGLSSTQGRQDHRRDVPQRPDESGKTAIGMDTSGALSWRLSGHHRNNMRYGGTMASGNGFHENKNMQSQRNQKNRKMSFGNRNEMFNSCTDTVGNRNESAAHRNDLFRNRNDSFTYRNDCLGPRQETFRKRIDSFETCHESLSHRGDSCGNYDEYMNNRHELHNRRGLPIRATDRDTLTQLRTTAKVSDDSKFESQPGKIRIVMSNVSKGHQEKSDSLYEKDARSGTTEQQNGSRGYPCIPRGARSTNVYSENVTNGTVARATEHRVLERKSLDGVNDERCVFFNTTLERNVSKSSKIPESGELGFNTTVCRASASFPEKPVHAKSVLSRVPVKMATEVLNENLSVNNLPKSKRSTPCADQATHKDSSEDCSKETLRSVSGNLQMNEYTSRCNVHSRDQHGRSPKENKANEDATLACESGNLKTCHEKSADTCVQDSHILSYQGLVFSDHQPVPLNSLSTYISSLTGPYGRPPLSYAPSAYPAYSHNVSPGWDPDRGAPTMDMPRLHGGVQGRNPIPSQLPNLCNEQSGSVVETPSNSHPCIVSVFRSNAPLVNPETDAQGLAFSRKVDPRDTVRPPTVVLSDDRKTMKNPYQDVRALHQRPSLVHHSRLPLVVDESVRDRMPQDMRPECSRNSHFYDGNVTHYDNSSGEVISKGGTYIPNVPGASNMMVMMTSSVPNASVNSEDISSLRNSYATRQSPHPSHVSQSYFYISQAPPLQPVDVYHHSLGRAVAVGSNSAAPNSPVHLSSNGTLSATQDQRVSHIIPAGYFHGISVFDTSSPLGQSTGKEPRPGEKCDASLIASNSPSAAYIHCYDAYSGQPTSHCGVTYFSDSNAMTTYSATERSGIAVAPAQNATSGVPPPPALITSHSLMSKDYYSLPSLLCENFGENDSERLKKSGHSRSHSRTERAVHGNAPDRMCDSSVLQSRRAPNSTVVSSTSYTNHENSRSHGLYNGNPPHDHDTKGTLKNNGMTTLTLERSEVTYDTLDKKENMTQDILQSKNEHPHMDLSPNRKKNASEDYPTKTMYRRRQRDVATPGKATMEATASRYGKEKEVYRTAGTSRPSGLSHPEEGDNFIVRSSQDPQGPQMKKSVKNKDQNGGPNRVYDMGHCKGQSQILKSAIKNVIKEESGPSGENEPTDKNVTHDFSGSKMMGWNDVKEDNYQRRGQNKKTNYTRRREKNHEMNPKGNWERNTPDRSHRDICRHFLMGRCTFANCNFLHINTKEQFPGDDNFSQKKAGHDAGWNTQSHKGPSYNQNTQEPPIMTLETSSKRPPVNQVTSFEQKMGGYPKNMDSMAARSIQTAGINSDHEADGGAHLGQPQDPARTSLENMNETCEAVTEAGASVKGKENVSQNRSKNQKSGPTTGSRYIYDHRHGYRGKSNTGLKKNANFSSKVTPPKQHTNQPTSHPMSDEAQTGEDNFSSQKAHLSGNTTTQKGNLESRRSDGKEIPNLGAVSQREPIEGQCPIPQKNQRCREDQAAQARHFISSLAKTFVTDSSKGAMQESTDAPLVMSSEMIPESTRTPMNNREMKHEDQRKTKNFRDKGHNLGHRKMEEFNSTKTTGQSGISVVSNSNSIEGKESLKKSCQVGNSSENIIRNNASKNKRYDRSNYRLSRDGSGGGQHSKGGVTMLRNKSENDTQLSTPDNFNGNNQSQGSEPKENRTKPKGERRRNRHGRARRQTENPSNYKVSYQNQDQVPPQ